MEANSTAAVPPTKILQNSSQGNHQVLLNAIKTKFANQPSNESVKNSFKLPQHLSQQPSIPLRVPGGGGGGSEDHSYDFPSKLNGSLNKNNNNSLSSFLLEQLNSKNLNGSSFHTNNGFILPKLQKNSNPNENITSTIPSLAKLKLPNTLLTKLPSETKLEDEKVSCLSSALKNKLKFVNKPSSGPELDLVAKSEETPQEDVKLEPDMPLIDLSSALNSSHEIVQMKKNHCSKPKKEEIFDIPFIGCKEDIVRNHHLTEDIINEHCQIDISKETFAHCLKEPSRFGRVICASYKRKSPPLKFYLADYLDDSDSKIKRFKFDTKSPDDKVLESMNKYKR